jgi:hypothetical protein
MASCNLAIKDNCGNPSSEQMTEMTWGLWMAFAAWVDHFIIRPKAKKPDGIVLGRQALQNACHCTNCGFVGMKRTAK